MIRIHVCSNNGVNKSNQSVNRSVTVQTSTRATFVYDVYKVGPGI